jgi:hypothetical protein
MIPMFASRLASRLRAHAPWLVFIVVACACTKYLNDRADLVPRWGDWYPEGQPYVILQIRAFLHGRTALVLHPSGAAHDYNWGRGGMHQAWGIGIPILATPLHLIALLFGAPGFPDDIRFLLFYGFTTAILARGLYVVSRERPGAIVASAAAAGFVLVYPTFVGLITSRFLVYEQTIGTGALWDVCLLAGILALLDRCTPGRLLALCAAAGFVLVIRPPLGVYGATTVVIALFIAWRAGLSRRALAGGFLAFLGTSAIYCLGNLLRFGAPFDAGYDNSLSGAFVNRLTRWGLPFAKVPFSVALKEMFATNFLLPPVTYQIMMGSPPAAVQPYTIGERFREYYAPTFSLFILSIWVVALVIVCWRFVAHRLWRADRPLRGEVLTVVGVWALPPSLALFAFYARVGQMVTRYSTDLYPAFAASALCVGMAIVALARKYGPSQAASVQLALAGGVALYIAAWPPWAVHLSHPVDAKAVAAQIARIEGTSDRMPPVPDHFVCNAPRGPSPVYTHLDDWHSDCSFTSGMVFAMPHDSCVTFTFRPHGNQWTSADEESLSALRVNADADPMVSCGAPVVEGDARKVTMCDPRPPRYLLDGLRLYAVATLDPALVPIDRLRLMRIDSARACP